MGLLISNYTWLLNELMGNASHFACHAKLKTLLIYELTKITQRTLFSIIFITFDTFLLSLLGFLIDEIPRYALKKEKG